MRKTGWLCLLLAGWMSGCEIREGSFDGGFWDDARVDDEDAGGEGPDAGEMTPDAGSDAGGDAATDSGMPSELTARDVPAVFARGVCGALEACMGRTLLLDSLRGNDCVEFTTKQQADRHLYWLPDSIESGRVTFRPDRLADCERDLVALGCEVRSRRLPASCEAAIEGENDVDESCTIDQDCAGNAWCDKGSLESCPGICVELQGQGLPCRSSMYCAEGLICRGGSCAAPLSEGDTCDEGAGLDCPPGLVCQGSSGMRTCRSIESLYTGEQGEDCDALGSLCKVGLVCQSQSSQNTMGTCQPLAPLDGTCRRAKPAQCPRSQYCKDARTNTIDPALPGQDGVCSDRPSDGESCIAGEDCAPGTACVGAMATCRSYKRAGGTCVGNAECYGGVCEDDICVIATIGCD